MTPLSIEQHLRMLTIFYYMTSNRARWRACRNVHYKMLLRGI